MSESEPGPVVGIFWPAGQPSAPVAPPPEPEPEPEPELVVVVVVAFVVVVVVDAFVVVVVAVTFGFVHGFAFVLVWPVLQTGVVHGFAFVLFWPVLQTGIVLLADIDAALAPKAPITTAATSSSSGATFRMNRIPTVDLLCVDKV